MATVRFNAVIPADLDRELRARAAAADRPVSRELTRALREYLVPNAREARAGGPTPLDKPAGGPANCVES